MTSKTQAPVKKRVGKGDSIALVLFFFFVVAAGLTTFSTLSKEVSITLVSSPNEQKVIIPITATWSTESDGSLLTVTRAVRRVSDERVFNIPTTTEVPARASGTITLVNTTNGTQSLAATTRLLSEDGLVYRIPERVDLPPHSRTEVTAVADQEGKAYEAQPGRWTIPGLRAANQELIYGENAVATTGGTTTNATLTDAVLASTQAELANALLATAQQANDATDIYFVTDVAVTTDVPIGTQTDSFTLSLTESIALYAIDQAALVTLAEKIAPEQELPDDLTYLDVDQTSLVIAVADEDADTQIVTGTLTFTMRTVPATRDNRVLLEVIAGKTESEAQAIIANDPTVESVTFDFSMFTGRKIPEDTDAITILWKTR